MKLREEDVRVAGPDCEIRSVVISPVAGGRGPAVLLYTDIFQLTESTLRTARRLASAGFVVCVPEIYPRGELAGVALEFDDAGKQAGLAGAATTTRQFDADRVAVLDFLERAADVDELCRGGLLHRRPPGVPRRVRPAGRGDGVLLPDRAARTARWARTPTPGRSPGAGDIGGRLMIVFGSQDPHVPADARVADRLGALRRRADGPRTARVRGRRARVHARRRCPARPGADRSRAGRGGVVPAG